jgi:hypothetical protein
MLKMCADTAENRNSAVNQGTQQGEKVTHARWSDTSRIPGWAPLQRIHGKVEFDGMERVRSQTF